MLKKHKLTKWAFTAKLDKYELNIVKLMDSKTYVLDYKIENSIEQL